MSTKNGTAEEKWASPNVIDWITFGKVGDSDTGAAFRKVQFAPTATRVDDTGTYIYMGWAEPGASDSGGVWRIARIDTSGNRVWADGDSLYDNIWDNRTGLSYV